MPFSKLILLLLIVLLQGFMSLLQYHHLVTFIVNKFPLLDTSCGLSSILQSRQIELHAIVIQLCLHHCLTMLCGGGVTILIKVQVDLTIVLIFFYLYLGAV